MKLFYHPHPPNTAIIEEYQSHPLMDLMFDLEQCNPPHTKYNSNMDACPAMKVKQQHTFIFRSPIDIEFKYHPTSGFAASKVTEEVFDLIVPPGEKTNPYLQLKLYHIFWTEKKSNMKLWMHDVPHHYLTEKPTFYVASGMIPIGTYIRNTSLGLVLNENETKIKLKRGQPVAAFTITADEQVKLIKKMPTQEILNINQKHFRTPRFCPYLSTKTVFGRWLGHDNS